MNANSCNQPPAAPPAEGSSGGVRPALHLNGAADNQPGSPRILIIDDTRAIHNDFRKILMPIQNSALDEATAELFDSAVVSRPQANFVVDSAYQGREGLALVQCALLEGRPYAVTFLDVRMPPGWDGVETAEKLWAVDPDLQIVLCSAYADYSWDDIVRRLQATDSLVILKKPFDNAEVLQLAHALEKKWRLARQSKSRMADLDGMVHQRTEELQRRAEMENIVSTLSTQFIGVSSAELEQAIPNALKVIATFAGADHGFLFGAAGGGRRDHHFEWHVEGVEPLVLGLEEISSDPSGWWMQKLGRLESIQIPRFAVLPAEAEAERALGESLGLQSLAVVPLVHGTTLLGFAGFASVRAERNWRNDNMAMLKIVGEIFANTLQRSQSELRLSAFSGLGLRLSAAQSAKEATRIIVDVADHLLGWDACFCDLYSPNESVQSQVLNIDTINGQRVECSPAPVSGEPPPNTRRALEKGGHLVLREKHEMPPPRNAAFGDTGRASASMLYVPIRNGTTAIGVLSIQSYTTNAYDQRSLGTLQTLADHCGGALERLRAQEASKDSEANYRSLVEGSPDAIFVHSKSRFVYANPSTQKLLQTPKAQLIGRSVLDFVHPSYREQIAQRLEQAAQGGSRPLMDQQMLLPDGSALDVEATSNPFTYEGKPAVQTVMRDISKRKQAEQRLSAFSALGLRLSAAQSAKEAARIIVDVADHLLGWNACFCDLYSPDERIQSHVLNIDTIDGQRVECATALRSNELPPMCRRTLEQGGQILLREKPELPPPGVFAFGDTTRLSASLLFVPIRNGTNTIGVLSIQSYTVNAYDQWSLETLQTLADHCGGALERIRAQEALKDSEANYRSLVERSPDAIFVHRDGRFVYANPSTQKLLQTAKTQLIGQTVLDFVHPSYREQIAQRIEQAAQGGSKPLLDHQIVLPDGSALDVEATSNPFTYEGQPAVQTVMRDISKRKQAELRLSAFSALGHRLSRAQSAKAAAQIVVEVADQLIGWDCSLCDLYSAGDDTWSHMLNIDIINGQRAECPPIMKTGRPSGLARKAMTEGGQLVLRAEGEQPPPGSLPFGDVARPSASLLYVPIRNDKQAIGLLSIQSYRHNAYDQHSLELLQALADHCGGALDRIRGQDALLKAEDRLHHVLAQSPAVLYSLKPEGKDFKLAWISENIAQLLGFSSEEAGRSDWRPTNLHAADHQQMEAARESLLREHRGAVEYRFRHKNGSYRWLRDEQRLICDTDGAPAEIVGTSMDITERKQLEELLRQSQKMEAIGQLAGGVAHDFNNLLAVIRGNTELLLLKPAHFSAEEGDCLKQVVAASERAAGLTRQLLAFGRKQMMQLQPLNLNDIVGNLTKMLKRIIGENIQLQCTYASRLPLVQADVGMLEQVMVNLVVNARDAMPEGGQLLLTTQAVHFSETSAPRDPEARAGEFVSLTVTDTGTGIATEHLSRIFEPFFTTKELGKGTGLGLATVYGIVKQHQGWIEVSSRLGKGSTFRVFLPAVQQPSVMPGEPTRPEEKLRGGKETILVVEDDEAVRSLTRRVLENFGYRVREAASGREALEVCRDNLAEIDLLLTDLIMPHGVSGRDLAEQLLTRRPALKALFMSGYSSESIGPETQFIQQLKARLLQKPCPWRELVRAVRDSLDTEVLQK